MTGLMVSFYATWPIGVTPAAVYGDVTVGQDAFEYALPEPGEGMRKRRRVAG